VDISEPDITAELLKVFANDHMISWAILMGSNSNIGWGGDYNITVVPTVFMIDGGGVIRQRYPYPVPDAATLSSEIDSLIVVTDLNGDGVANIVDISIVARAFGSKSGSPNWNPVADLN
jgi:hypothetical protein